jgi:hypothetical protein
VRQTAGTYVLGEYRVCIFLGPAVHFELLQQRLSAWLMDEYEYAWREGGGIRFGVSFLAVRSDLSSFRMAVTSSSLAGAAGVNHGCSGREVGRQRTFTAARLGILPAQHGEKGRRQAEAR